jgi:D-alanine-D-alanine ligase
MRVLILHQQVPNDASAAEYDVYLQRDAVAEGLTRLGHEVQCWACDLALNELADRVRATEPQLVFNLVESLCGADQLISLVPLVLDTLGVPYTGAPSQALLLSSNKVIAKRQLLAAGLPTPPWFEAEGGSELNDAATLTWPSCWIRKPVWEHASLGMTDEAVGLYYSADELVAATRQWQQRLQCPCFAEAFIEGREFNFSLLEGSRGAEVLPPAEIDFANYPAGRPRIVGLAAKWDDHSAEAILTPRRFTFAPSDAPLLRQLRELALACWHTLGLRGYCRVDFRVDSQGSPWILELNANPCLTPGSGFAAAVAQAGYAYHEAIDRIVQSATWRQPLAASRN